MVDRVVAAGYRIRTRLDGTTEAFALSAQDLALALGSKVSDLSCAVALSARTDDYSCVNDSCSGDCILTFTKVEGDTIRYCKCQAK